MKKALLSIPFFALVNQVNAQEINHFITEDKATLGYHITQVDSNVLGQTLDFSVTGYEISVGHQWQNNLYVRTDYKSSEGEAKILEIDNTLSLSTLSLVTGFQFEVSQHSRLFAEAGYAAQAVEVSNFAVTMDDTVGDYLLGVGYKHQIGNLIAEVNTHYFNGENQYGAELLYAFNTKLAIAAGASTIRDEISYNAQLVFNY